VVDKPTFDHWSLWDKVTHQVRRVFGLIRWGVLQRKRMKAQMLGQRLVIDEINSYFCRGWNLFGQGVVPWCTHQFSTAWVNTVFAWQTDDGRRSYFYRIGNEEVEGELALYCLNTAEVLELEGDMTLNIASLAVALIVHGEDWSLNQFDTIKQGIAGSFGLIQTQEAK